MPDPWENLTFRTFMKGFTCNLSHILGRTGQKHPVNIDLSPVTWYRSWQMQEEYITHTLAARDGQ